MMMYMRRWWWCACTNLLRRQCSSLVERAWNVAISSPPRTFCGVRARARASQFWRLPVRSPRSPSLAATRPSAPTQAQQQEESQIRSVTLNLFS